MSPSPAGRLDPAARAAEVRRVLTQVLVLNLAVAAVKFAAFLSSNALSILAETVHSSLDAANNVFALWIARIAARGPDADHPYGHHKFETLGALALVGLLSITVFELVQHSILRMMAGETAAEASGLAIGIIAVSAGAALGVSWWETRRGRALGSDILLADAAHTRADVYTTIAVLVGLGLMRAGYPLADPLVAVAVATIIAHTGWSIVRSVVPVLVDEVAVDPGQIRSIAEAHEGVFACYGIRSRGRPGEAFAELTISVDPSLDVAGSHTIADDVERQVSSVMGARDVVVHVEPARR